MSIIVGIVSEFKKFDADLKNPNWSVSSISSNKELIVSLWGHKPLMSKLEIPEIVPPVIRSLYFI